MRKYSKAQEVYMLAKAHLETLEDQEKELERMKSPAILLDTVATANQYYKEEK